jgi:hypothetical protein
MTDDLLYVAWLFRAAASQLQRLSRGSIRTKRDTIVAMETYVYQDQVKSAPAFPPDRCQETANLLEEFADKLEALRRGSRQRS